MSVDFITAIDDPIIGRDVYIQCFFYRSLAVKCWVLEAPTTDDKMPIVPLLGGLFNHCHVSNLADFAVNYPSRVLIQFYLGRIAIVLQSAESPGCRHMEMSWLPGQMGLLKHCSSLVIQRAVAKQQINAVNGWIYCTPIDFKKYITKTKKRRVVRILIDKRQIRRMNR